MTTGNGMKTPVRVFLYFIMCNFIVMCLFVLYASYQMNKLLKNHLLESREEVVKIKLEDIL